MPIVSEDDKSNLTVEYCISIPNSDRGKSGVPDFLIISDLFGLSIRITNGFTGEQRKDYYELEVDTKSMFHAQLKEVVKRIFNLRDNDE